MINLEVTKETFIYPDHFSLSDQFHTWWKATVENQITYPVRLLVPGSLKACIQEQILQSKVPWMPLSKDYSQESWEELTINFTSLENARTKLLVFGGAIKVVEPLALRYSMADYASQILSLYMDE
jgi:predicted DNA-binding transcriptional regulator YafY